MRDEMLYVRDDVLDFMRICTTLYKIAECAIIVTVGEVPTMILEI